MSDVVYGIDTNEWNGPINMAVAKAAGAGFAGPRTSILHAEDLQFENTADQCEAEGVPYFPWHFLSEHGDAVWQAELFCDLIEDRAWQLRPVVDCELWTDPIGILPFCEYVKNRLKVTPRIYTEYYWWKDNVGNNPIYAAYSLWACRWAEGLTGPWGDGQRQILPWEEWDVWQQSSDGNGRGAEFGAESADIGFNIFNGGERALQAEIVAVHAERYGVVPPTDLEVRVERLEAGLAQLRVDTQGAFEAAQEILGG